MIVRDTLIAGTVVLDRDRWLDVRSSANLNYRFGSKVSLLST